jgi:tetratricopeptide (TPR) repeat protein
MSPDDVGVWVRILETQGFEFIRERASGVISCVDIVVIDQNQGPTGPCMWITTDVVEGIRWAWLAGMDPGELCVPTGWSLAASADIMFTSYEDLEGVEISQVDGNAGLGAFLDPQTGETRYVGRAFMETQSMESELALAFHAIESENYGDAVGHFLAAERCGKLELEFQFLLASAYSSLISVDFARNRHLLETAWARWTNVIEDPIGRYHPHAWYGRGQIARMSRLYEAAIESLDECIRLDDKYAFALAERALVGLWIGEDQKKLQKLLKKARKIVEKTGNSSAQFFVQAVSAETLESSYGFYRSSFAGAPEF